MIVSYFVSKDLKVLKARIDITEKRNTMRREVIRVDLKPLDRVKLR